MTSEADNVRLRYQRRRRLDGENLYSMLNPSHYMTIQEKERALIRWIKACGIQPLETKRVLEIGCGSGDNLLQFLRLGFRPENITGNELIEERASRAGQALPGAIKIIQGDALTIDLPDHSFDVIFQSTVFTSLLDNEFQARLAEKLWALLKPGGGILWYDFIYNNPKNPDVRGVPIHRINTLFPAAGMWYRRVTLAPPVSRLVSRFHPCFYTLFNIFPFLRTHILAWIEKPLAK